MVGGFALDSSNICYSNNYLKYKLLPHWWLVLLSVTVTNGGWVVLQTIDYRLLKIEIIITLINLVE